MASIRQKPGSPFWFACLTLPTGRTERTTKIRHADGVQARRRAQQLADLWERDLLDQREAQRAHAVVDEIMGMLHGKNSVLTVSSYLKKWLEDRAGEVSESTSQVYEKRLREFSQTSGRVTLSQLRVNHVRTFRDDLAQRIGGNTVNKYLSTLKAALQDAVRDGHLANNPCDALRPLKAKQETHRRPFTIDELKRIYEIASAEWRSMILFGLYTGQRLQDVATLTWANLDLEAAELRLATGKTGRRMAIPLHRCLVDHVLTLPLSEDAHQPIHPEACSIVEKTGRVSLLSTAFREILANAGLAKRRGAKSDQGSNRRQISELSFHSLRHTATSLLKQAGISGPVVQELIGHESAAVNQIYTHIDAETLREANAKLPSIGGSSDRRC